MIQIIVVSKYRIVIVNLESQLDWTEGSLEALPLSMLTKISREY